MFDNIRIIDTLRNAGFEAGEISVNPEPGVRDVTITRAAPDPVTGEPRHDVATEAARALAKAGFNILCYGTGLGVGRPLATLVISLPKSSLRAA